MIRSTENQSSCSGCSVTSCKGRGDVASEIMRGWGFAAACAGTFLMPLALAVVGAGIGGPEAFGQFVGGAGGLIGGMLISVLIGRALRRNSSEDPSTS